MGCYKTSCKCVSFLHGILSPVPFLCPKFSWYYDAGTLQYCQAATGEGPRFHNSVGAGCMGYPKISCTWSTYWRGNLSRIFPVHLPMHWPPQFAFPHHSCHVGKMRVRTQDTWSGHWRWLNLLTQQPNSFWEEQRTLFLIVVTFPCATLVISLSSPPSPWSHHSPSLVISSCVWRIPTAEKCTLRLGWFRSSPNIHINTKSFEVVIN